MSAGTDAPYNSSENVSSTIPHSPNAFNRVKLPFMESQAALTTQAIENPFGAPVYYRDCTGSTMSDARELAEQGAAHGTVIAAGYQRAGRGRVATRRWQSEPGKNLLFTILLRYDRYAVVPPALSLRAGLAVAHAIEEYAPLLAGVAQVKWPNDVMLSGKKTAGIITEGNGQTFYIGIGVNVAQEDFGATGTATSIALQAGRELPEKSALLALILRQLHAELAGVDTGWQKRLEARLYMRGQEVCFRPGAADSADLIRGCLEGIDSEGALRIRREGAAVPDVFTAGELRAAILGAGTIRA
jgi:BirA family biotin operon repressor/biotin-[acetyl-CoA-carboxylase] ligase